MSGVNYYDCQHCEKRFTIDELTVDPGNACYECPKCGCQFFAFGNKEDIEWVES